MAYNIVEAARLAYDAYSASIKVETERRKTIDVDDKPKPTDKRQSVARQPIEAWSELDEKERKCWIDVAKAAITHYVTNHVLHTSDMGL